MLRVLIAEWVVECRSSSPEVMEGFRRVLGPAPRAPDPDRPADVVFEAVLGSDPGPTSRLPPTVDQLADDLVSKDNWTLVEEENGMSLWSGPEGAAVLTHGPSHAALEPSTAVFHFPDIDAVHQSLHAFVTAATNHVARAGGLVPAHSALVCVDDVWMLLLGNSGVGKSTSCLAVSTAGHAVAGDDTCLLRHDDGRLLGHGLPRAPSLPKTVHGLAVDGPTDHRERTSEPDFPLVQGWHEISGVLVLRHGDAALTELGPVAVMDVIEAITSAVAGALSVDVVVDAVPDVLRATTARPARTLALGKDSSRRLASIDDALRTAAAEFRADS